MKYLLVIIYVFSCEGRFFFKLSVGFFFRAPASSLTARSVCDAPDDAHDDDSPTSAFVPLASHLHPLPSPSMLPSPWVGLLPRSLFGCRVPHPFLDASIHFGCLRPCCAPFPSSSPFGRVSPSLFGCLRPWILTLLRLLPYLDASPPSRSLTMLRTCMRTFSHVLYFAHRVTFHIG